MTDQRIKKAFGLLKKNSIDVLIVTDMTHVRYLSGFTGSNGIVVLAPPKAYFLTDFRYTVQAQKEVKSCQVMIASRQLITELPKIPVFSKGIRAGIEADFMSLNLFEKIKELLPSVAFKRTEQIVESLSVVKDADEVGKIRKAVRIADKAFSQIVKRLKPGVKEKDIALELEYSMIKLGAEDKSFETIIASGQRSSMPHGRASDKKLRKGDFITLDFGCMYQGYASDITRTVVLGKATARQKEIYDIVLTAQRAACKAVKPGMACSKVDAVARDIIMKAGYGDYFGHGLGHGIGLLVHDKPVLSQQSNDILAPGMVVTIEPGIYIPSWGGVRIEDDVLVTSNGGQILSRSPKELMEL